MVDNDNIKAGYDATKYFLDQGYKKIAFLAGNKELVVSQDRFTGYKQALEEAGIPLDENIVKFSFGFLLEDSSYKIMEKMPIQEIEAFVTSDSMVAEGALHYLKDIDYRFPIVTFDSIKPRIDVDAYIDINTLELGRESFRTLLQIIKDNKDDKHTCYRQVIPHSILTR